MNSNKSISFSLTTLAVVISSAIGAVVGILVVQSMFKSSSNRNVDAVLQRTAEVLNKQLPMTIDKYTRLDTTVALPDGKFKYKYTVFSTDDLPRSAEFEKTIKPKLINIYQTSDDMKQLRVVNATLVYSYFLEDGTSYASFEIVAGESSSGVAKDTNDP